MANKKTTKAKPSERKTLTIPAFLKHMALLDANGPSTRYNGVLVTRTAGGPVTCVATTGVELAVWKYGGNDIVGVDDFSCIIPGNAIRKIRPNKKTAKEVTICVDYGTTGMLWCGDLGVKFTPAEGKFLTYEDVWEYHPVKEKENYRAALYIGVSPERLTRCATLAQKFAESWGEDPVLIWRHGMMWKKKPIMMDIASRDGGSMLTIALTQMDTARSSTINRVHDRNLEHKKKVVKA